MENCRNLIEDWADDFPDRDGKLIDEFQISFNSPFWEIYLYATLRKMGMAFDWGNSSPDFVITSQDGRTQFCIEAVIANAASGKLNEWDNDYSEEKVRSLSIPDINHEAMIRIANAITSKHKKFIENYSKLPHAKGKPFVIALAPFEQPFFNHQYHRPIRSVLYDNYVDEFAYEQNPSKYPFGPPIVHLNFIKKSNGSDIELGFFNDDRMKEVSAIIFSCTATFGKVEALASPADNKHVRINSIWGADDHGKPIQKYGSPSELNEALHDGLQIYHNPNAKYPLPLDIFKHSGIVQEFYDKSKNSMIIDGLKDSLIYRQTHTFIATENPTKNG